MSKLADVAKTAQSLSLTAMEEASRVGLRTSDIDHLFLALVLSNQHAGRVLRGSGITLEEARRAVAEQHAAQLASVGISVGAADPGRIVFNETGGYTWSDRVLDIFKESCRGGKRGDAAAVLRELLDEPSGMIAEVLYRLGTSPDTIRRRLDEDAPAARPAVPVSADGLTGHAELFVPAPVDEVWMLLADPFRMPDWEPSIGGVVDAGGPVRPGDVWIAHRRERRPDGKPLRIAPALRRIRVEVEVVEEQFSIGWSFSTPDAPDANTRCVRISLAATEGGTRLRMMQAWQRPPARRVGPVRARLLRPLYRFVTWMQLFQLGVAIGRVFR